MLNQSIHRSILASILFRRRSTPGWRLHVCRLDEARAAFAGRRRRRAFRAFASSDQSHVLDFTDLEQVAQAAQLVGGG